MFFVLKWKKKKRTNYIVGCKVFSVCECLSARARHECKWLFVSSICLLWEYLPYVFWNNIRLVYDPSLMIQCFHWEQRDCGWTNVEPSAACYSSCVCLLLSCLKASDCEQRRKLEEMLLESSCSDRQCLPASNTVCMHTCERSDTVRVGVYILYACLTVFMCNLSFTILLLYYTYEDQLLS